MASASFDPLLYKLDNTQVVDYLVSMASALASSGVLAEQDSDNLRLLISGVQSKRNSQPILLQLIEQNADFLDLLEIRYGSTAHAMNLLRHTGRPHLDLLMQRLSEWGEKMLERAKLGFNRPLFVYQEGECQRQQLLSTHLIAFAEILAHGLTVIKRIQDAWECLYPHDMAGENEADRKVCESCADALGFRSVLTSQPTTYPESEEKAEVAIVLSRIATAAVDLIRRINQNTGTTTRYPVIVAGDRLKLACDQLREQSLPQVGSSMTFEVRRLHLMETFTIVVEQVTALSAMTLEAVASDMPLTKSRLQEVAPESAKRRVAFVLIEQRVSAKTAWQASEALFGYLRDKNIGPDKLIVSELTKIHNALTPEALTVLQQFSAGTSLMSMATGEKGRNLDRVNVLGKVFAQISHATTVMVLLFAALPSITGCGLKANPYSDRLEPRPEIPFNAETQALPSFKNDLQDEETKAISPEKEGLKPIPPKH